MIFPVALVSVPIIFGSFDRHGSNSARSAVARLRRQVRAGGGGGDNGEFEPYHVRDLRAYREVLQEIRAGEGAPLSAYAVAARLLGEVAGVCGGMKCALLGFSWGSTPGLLLQ